MKLEIDVPALEAGRFWKALRDRDVIKAFELLSAENKGFVMGYLHSIGIITVNRGTAYHQFYSDEIQEVLKKKMDKYVTNLPLDHAPTNKAIFHDELHATCKLIPEEKYNRVVFIKPTVLPERPLLLSMVLELFSLDPIKMQWRVDFFHLNEK